MRPQAGFVDGARGERVVAHDVIDAVRTDESQNDRFLVLVVKLSRFVGHHQSVDRTCEALQDYGEMRDFKNWE